MSEKLDFDPATNPTRNLNGTTSAAVVVLFDTEDKAEALLKAQAIPGFTADPTKVGPVDDWQGMSVVGQATLPIEEEGDVLGVFNFAGVIDSCSVCSAGN